MMLDRAERQAAQRPYELLELAGETGVDRPVAGIVRARRYLVDEEVPTLGHEHFDRQDPDEIELLGDMTRDRLGLHRGLSLNSRRCDRGVEDMIDMLVFDRWIGRPVAVCAARDDDRDLAGKIDEAFEDPDLASHSSPGFLGLDLRGQGNLALAVISEAYRLQHRGRSEI